MASLFRAMRKNKSGLPDVGPHARALGVRPGTDVLATLPGDLVQPGLGGLSVSPGQAANLPYFRRPQQLGGTGKDPVWVIDSSLLGSNLVYRPDPSTTTHGLIEPSKPMTLDDFQNAIAATQTLWRQVP
ncbi:MAG TPA: hypothetical protein VNH11_13665 [Pirellulales bacterium]|nr:hypothetical protein [Pirellulales bacterium]